MKPLCLKFRSVLATFVVVAIAAFLAGTASAIAPQPVTLAMTGAIVGPGTVQGMFSASGAIADSGTYVETFRIVGSTIHVTQEFAGGKGAIVVNAEAIVVYTSATTVSFRSGHWQIASGTGDYDRLRAGGSPASSPTSTVDLATGRVTVTHLGTVHRG